MEKDNFIPEVWSKAIVEQTFIESIYASITEKAYDGEIKNQGDIVEIPHLELIPKNNQRIDYDVQSKEISINKHKYFAFRVEDVAKCQAQPELIESHAKHGARGLANVIDKDIGLLIKDERVTKSVGALIDKEYIDITIEAIRCGIMRLDEANAPEEGRYLIIPQRQVRLIQTMPTFTETSKLDTLNINTKNLLGSIYGVLIYVSRNLPDIRNDKKEAYKAGIMFQKDAIALCIQKRPRVQSAYDLDFLSTSVVGDILYGYDILDPDYIIEMRMTAEI